MKSKLLKVTLALFATAWVGGAQAEVKTIFTRTLWTFNDLTYTAEGGVNPFPSNTSGTNTDLNGEGLLYTGGDKSSLATVPSTDIAFSEGTEVKGITKVIELQEQNTNWTSVFNNSRTGESYIGSLNRSLAFNTTVPGTTYVMMKRTGSYAADKNFEIWIDYKSTTLSAESATKVMENNADLVEVSLHGKGAGTFWIRGNKKVQVYAILFIPDPVNVTVGEHLYTTFYNNATAGNLELPEGLTAYGVSSQVSARTGQTVTLSPYNVIPAGAGVILKGSEAKAYVLNYTKTESTYTGTNYMVGTATEIAELPYNNYVLVYDSEDGKVKFARSSSGGKPNVPAGHAYLSSAVYSAPSSARPNYLFLDDDDEVTGVSAISTQTEASGTWYTLGGQRIAAPTAHGVYIKNGKKIIIK